MLVGYDSNIKVYRLYNPFNRKMMVLKDVVTDEKICGIRKIMQPKQEEEVTHLLSLIK